MPETKFTGSVLMINDIAHPIVDSVVTLSCPELMWQDVVDDRIGAVKNLELGGFTVKMDMNTDACKEIIAWFAWRDHLDRLQEVMKQVVLERMRKRS